MERYKLLLVFLNCVLFSHIVLPQGNNDFGFILIKSLPENAEVYINGKATGGKTPFQSQLDVGIYRVTLKLPELSYHDYNGRFEINKDRTTIVEATLKPNFGNVYIESNPRGAKIRIDGIAMGETPRTIRELKSGQHTVELEMDNYNPLRHTFIVKDEETTNLSLDLFAGFGTIGIIVMPREAEIFINNEYKTNGFYSGQLSSGTHNIEIKKQGYYPVMESIRIGQGEEKRLQYEIKPILGSVSVMVDPPETNVYINDEFKGPSPLIIPNLIIGEYDLELRKQGYANLRKKVQVNENQVTAVNQTMFDGFNVRVVTTPTDAEVYMGNKIVGNSPAYLLLPRGITYLEFRKNYYFSKIEKITPSHNDQEFRIELLRGTSEIRLRSNIRGSVAKLEEVLNNTEPLIFNLPGAKLTSSSYIVPAGIYKLSISKKSYRTIEKEINLDIDGFDQTFILYPEIYRSKGRALLRSLMWPGAGQSWIKRSGAEPLIGVVAWGALAGGIYKSIDASRLYDEYMESGSATDRARFKSEYQSSHDLANMLFVSSGIVWGINMVWTFIVPSEKSRYSRLGWTGYIDPSGHHVQFGFVLNR